MSKEEKEYFQECQRRPELTDAEFAKRYYFDSGIALDIPARVRRTISYQLKLPKLIPSDNICRILDVDLAELVWEVAEEFNVKVALDEMRGLDGSVDSIIRLMAAKVGRQATHREVNGH